MYVYIYIHMYMYLHVYLFVQDLTALVADFGLARMFPPLDKKEAKSNGRSRGARRR